MPWPARSLQCPGCATEFTCTHPQQRFCGKACRRRHNHQHEYQPRRYRKQCRWCGAPFDSRNKAQLACSRKCNASWSYQANRTANIERVNAWSQRHPERFQRRMAEARARRRARIANAKAGVVTDRDLRRQRQRQRHCCAYCGEQKPLTLEHVVPLARGGSHSIGNLIWVCRSCNCSKRQRLLIEWRVIRARALKAAA